MATRLGPTVLLIAGMGCCTTGYLLFTRFDTDFSNAAMRPPTRLLLNRGLNVALTGYTPPRIAEGKLAEQRTRDADRA